MFGGFDSDDGLRRDGDGVYGTLGVIDCAGACDGVRPSFLTLVSDSSLFRLLHEFHGDEYWDDFEGFSDDTSADETFLMRLIVS